MADLSRSVAVVGVAESDQIGKVEGKSALQHHAEAAYNALDDAGMSMADVDGLLSAGISTMVLAEYLGIAPTFTDSTSVGGSSFIIHMAHAVAAINAGYCEVALVTHGQTGRSTRSGTGGGGGSTGTSAMEPGPQYEAPYGFIGQPVSYSLACRRYMHEYGDDRTRQAMAEIAVATRKWALLNPKAYMKDPMSFADYHGSRWVSWPFHLFDCCIVTDGGGAYVVTTPERARDLKKRPVWVLGAAEGHDHAIISQMSDLTRTWAGFSGPRSLNMAGVSHDDVDLAMVYDSFTYTVLITLESLGFCGPGEGPDFVADQRTAPGGDFPMNTSGGGLSYCHTGMYGMFLVIEAVRQMRNEAGARQLAVPPKISLVNGTGGSLSSTGTTVLGIDWVRTLMTQTYKKPVPVPQGESDFYWEKARQHELWLRKCNSCGEPYFYPRDISPCCFARDTTWVRASGKATLYTYGIVHRAPHPGFEAPFVAAIVELEEGPRMPTNIVMDDPTPEKLQIGMPLDVVFGDITEEIALPKFRPT